MDTSGIADLVSVGNQAALQWYSTVTQKPVQTGTPRSTMQNVFGADLSGGATMLGKTTSPIGIILVIAIVVVGVVLVARK